MYIYICIYIYVCACTWYFKISQIQEARELDMNWYNPLRSTRVWRFLPVPTDRLLRFLNGSHWSLHINIDIYRQSPRQLHGLQHHQTKVAIRALMATFVSNCFWLSLVYLCVIICIYHYTWKMWVSEARSQKRRKPCTDLYVVYTTLLYIFFICLPNWALDKAVKRSKKGTLKHPRKIRKQNLFKHVQSCSSAVCSGI